MSAAPPPTGRLPHWFNWQWVVPACLTLLIAVGLVSYQVLRQASPEEIRQASREEARRAGQEAVEAMTEAQRQAQAEKEAAKRTPKPYYNFLTCDGVPLNETCEPVFAYPVTPEALALIGFEPNTTWPNMERSRSVFIQWRNMHGVNECDLSIAIEPLGQPGPDGRPVADRKLFPTREPGRAALLDCTPRAPSPQTGIPTRGSS